MTVMTVMSFSNGDDNNHDFCGNDGQLCDVRDMILRCTNILPPPPQQHNSNITNFFYKWLFGLVYWSKDCRLPVVLMQASSSIWTPTMRDTRSTTSYLLVIGNVPRIGPKSLILAPQDIPDISGYQLGFGCQCVKAYNNENPVTNQKIL